MTKNNNQKLSSALDKISDIVTQRVVFQSKCDVDAIALWIAGTYLMDQWSCFPKLLLVSPERECGKTTALQAIEALVLKGVLASSITASALYRYIESDAPTLLIDEADLTLKNNEELQAVINAGHTIGSAFKILSVKKSDGEWVPKKMSLWCPQVIAGIGEFGDTLTSRSIHIGLRRKGIAEQVVRIKPSYFEDQEEIRECLSKWAKNINCDHLLLDPVLPNEIGNRALDNWIPLFQIANLAGEEWKTKGLKAIEELEIKRKKQSSNQSASELLTDLRDILKPFSGPEIGSGELLRKLLQYSEGDWNSANYGKAITARWLAKQLRPYGIISTHRSHGNVYLMADFGDAFTRYLPPSP